MPYIGCVATDPFQDALARLSLPGVPIHEAKSSVPVQPGLYSVHGNATVWNELGLGEPPDDRPLYVGKSEDSLLSRDVQTHFGTGRTGSSTLRRSLAALLVEHLDLSAQPRNPAKPSHFANYGLEPEGDLKLTAWMNSQLSLSVWPNTPNVVLADLETRILLILEPPLNLSKVRTRWKPQVSQARAVLADQARAWQP